MKLWPAVVRVTHSHISPAGMTKPVAMQMWQSVEEKSSPALFLDLSVDSLVDR